MATQRQTSESFAEMGERAARVLGQVTTHLETFDARILMLSARVKELEAQLEALDRN